VIKELPDSHMGP